MRRRVGRTDGSCTGWGSMNGSWSGCTVESGGKRGAVGRVGLVCSRRMLACALVTVCVVERGEIDDLCCAAGGALIGICLGGGGGAVEGVHSRLHSTSGRYLRRALCSGGCRMGYRTMAWSHLPGLSRHGVTMSRAASTSGECPREPSRAHTCSRRIQKCHQAIAASHEQGARQRSRSTAGCSLQRAARCCLPQLPAGFEQRGLSRTTN